MTLERAAACPRRGGSFVWLELYEPGTEEMGGRRAHFGLHELAVEDAARAHQRPKVESYDDFYFIVFRKAAAAAQEKQSARAGRAPADPGTAASAPGVSACCG
jgi:magnesium transporter